MAVSATKQGLLNGTATPSASTASPAASGTQPYQGGLQTNFTNQSAYIAPAGFRGGESGYNYNTGNSSDADVNAAQYLTNEMGNAAAGKDSGVDSAADQAQLNMYEGRIVEKNSLSDAINQNPALEAQAEDTDRSAANSSLASGVKNTQQNYNNRGLLYSGMRQGGEDSVREGVASQMASNLAGTKSDYANSLTSAKNAYASVDLANAQDQIDRSNAAFDTANQNNIARLQAQQQLGEGLGKAVGGVMGSMNSTPAVSPTTGWTPQQLSLPDIGSSVTGQQSSGGLL
jgi:hypothetical protein